MVYKKNKAIAIVIAFVFCLSFLAPAMISPSVAQAADAIEYSYVGSGQFKTSDTAQSIGKIVVNVDDVKVLNTYAEGGNYLSVNLPEGMTFNVSSTLPNGLYDGSGLVELGSKIIATNYASTYPANVSVDKRTLNLKVYRDAGQSGSESFTIKLDVIVKDAAGDVSVMIGGPTVFPQTFVNIGKTVTSGSTTTMVKSVKTFGDGGGTIDDIIIMENMKNTFKADETITLKLPNGFVWNKDNTAVTGDWGLAGYALAAGNANITANGRELQIKLANLPATRTDAARLVINGAVINIEDTGRTGDISVNVKSSGDVTETDVVVAKYGDYKVLLSEDTTKELTAGKTGQKLGTFLIEEEIPESLIAGRTVVFELPAGVKWTGAPTITAKKGSNILGTATPVSGSKGRAIKYTVDTGSRSSLVKLAIESGKVYVEPGFSGPIEVEVSGTAGVEGTVKVAEVAPAITLKAEGVKDIIIGEQNQQVADILIVESKAEAILRDSNHDQIVLAVDDGYKFYKKPTVTVSEGDLEIDSYKLNSSNTELTIKIKYNSTKASTIKIADVYLTGFRSAPEGPVVAVLKEAKGAVGNGSGSTALDEGRQYLGETANEFSEVSAGKVVIANCVTPANSGASISFKIASNIYTVNGIAKVMDVAPYIKGDRTYVPMRYLGEVLGAEVVWDDAARTVTLTKGETTAVFTIGSNAYTVNGESKTADVAPEIASDRTMLPARYVAEAFGAQVGWDAASQTVIISQL